MPWFAADISTMFTKVPFLQRFAQPAETGFSAVEFQYAFEFSAEELATHVSAAGVSVELINAPSGEPSTALARWGWRPLRAPSRRFNTRLIRPCTTRTRSAVSESTHWPDRLVADSVHIKRCRPTLTI